ncbi:MAG TPA: hypothetical protein VMR76_02845 [Candidatus Saccharimonadia bacterium]|nr:hypothetical protein [Candidatus Saccharimonadia bacterium]
MGRLSNQNIRSLLEQKPVTARDSSALQFQDTYERLFGQAEREILQLYKSGLGPVAIASKLNLPRKLVWVIISKNMST